MISQCQECGESGQLCRAEDTRGAVVWVCFPCYAGIRDEEGKE